MALHNLVENISKTPLKLGYATEYSSPMPSASALTEYLMPWAARLLSLSQTWAWSDPIFRATRNASLSG